MLSLIDRAALAILFGRYQDAEILLTEAGTTDPHAGDKGRAALAVHRGDREQALKLLNGLGNDPEAQMMLGHLELEQGESSAALARAQAVARQHPELATPALLEGRCLRALGRHAEAQAAFARAAERAPQSYEAHMELAQELLAQKDYPRALESALAAAECEPGLPAAYVSIGRTLIFLRAADRAQKIVSEAIERITGPEPALLEVLAEAALVNGDRTAALAALDQLASHVEARPDTEVRLAELYGGAGAHEAAEQHLQAAFKLDPNHPRALFIAGQLRAARGELADAILAYRRAYEGGMQAAAINLAATLLELADPSAEQLAEAESLLNQSEGLPQSTNAILYNRALLAARRNQTLEAKTILSRLLRSQDGEIQRLAHSLLRKLEKTS